MKRYFELIYQKYHDCGYLGLDPLICVHRFTKREDVEIGGLIASLLAYGRVETIVKSINRVFSMIGCGPAEFACSTDLKEKRQRLDGFRHRFNTGEDIALLFESLGRLIKEYGTLEKLFIEALEKSGSFRGALTVFAQKIRGAPGEPQDCSKGFNYLVSSPQKGSACKRLVLYLRWMVREKDGVDLGVWKDVSPSVLLFPVDTHIANLASRYGITERKSADWKMAEEITAFFRTIDPCDPVKFDFSLCRAGMIDFRKADECE